MRTPVLLVVSSLALASGCATAPKPAPSSSASPEVPAAAPEEKFDLEGMVARELKPMAKRKVASPDGKFSAEVEAVGEAKITPGEQFTIFEIPIGTGDQLTCFHYAHPLDAGGSLQRLAKSAEEKTQVQAVRVSDIVALAENPAVFLEVEYVVPTKGGVAAGMMKAMLYANPDIPVLCVHDELGYRESFKRISLDLVRSASVGASSEARYQELQLVKLNDRPVGFERRVMMDGEGNTVVTELTTAMMLPRSAKELIVEDTAATSLSDKSGQLIELTYAKASNGELSVQVAAKRKAGNEYTYSGTHSGKEVSGAFKTKDRRGVATDLMVSRGVKEKLLSGKAKELKFELYQPSLNPAGAVEVVCRKDAKSARALSLQLGPMKLDGTADEHGMLERVEMAMGKAKLVQERVFERGTP